jgi:hypothetical protein
MFAQSSRPSNIPVSKRSRKKKGRAKSKPTTVVTSSAQSTKRLRHAKSSSAKTNLTVSTVCGGTNYRPFQRRRASSGPPRNKNTTTTSRLKSKPTRRIKRFSAVAGQRRQHRRRLPSPAVFSSVSTSSAVVLSKTTTPAPPCPASNVPSQLSHTTGTNFFRNIIETTFGTAPGSPRRAAKEGRTSDFLGAGGKAAHNPRVRKLKKGKKTKGSSSKSSSDEGGKDRLLLLSCDDSYVLELLSSGDTPEKKKEKKTHRHYYDTTPFKITRTKMETSVTKRRRHPLSKLSNVSPFTPQPQKAPTPMARITPIPSIPWIPPMASLENLEAVQNMEDPFVVHDIDPMEIQIEGGGGEENDDGEDDKEKTNDEDEDEAGFVDCVDDSDDVESNQIFVPTSTGTNDNEPKKMEKKKEKKKVSAQAQYVHFIKTVLSKRRPTINNTDQENQKKTFGKAKGKRKLTKATESVIERMKNQAWEKLQREKKDQENSPALQFF